MWGIAMFLAIWCGDADQAAIDAFETGNQKQDEWLIEQAIEKDPTDLEAYATATRIYAVGNNALWALLYGQVYLLYAPEDESCVAVRTALVDVYRSHFKWGEEPSVGICNDGYAALDDLKDADQETKRQEMSRHFEIMFEQVISLAFFKMMEQGTVQQWPSPQGLVQLNADFLRIWTGGGNWARRFPNLILDELSMYEDKGILDAYSWWLIQDAYPQAFATWKANHPKVYAAFTSFRNQEKYPKQVLKNFTRSAYYRDVHRALEPPEPSPESSTQTPKKPPNDREQ